MSKPYSDFLFQLIKSLDKAEKKHFTRFASRLTAGAVSSRKLFQAIDKQKQYDESALRKSETYLSGFAQQKKFLTQLLLRSLRDFHSEINSAAIIHSLLEEAEILRRKRFFPEATSLLIRAKKQAIASGNDAILLHVSALLDDSRFESRQTENATERSASFAAEKQALIQLNELIQQKNLTKEIYEMHQQFHNLPDKKTESRLRRLAASQQRPISPRAHWYYYNSRAAFHMATGKPELAIHAAEENVRMIEMQELRIRDSPYEYVKALSTLLVLQESAEKFKPAFDTIRKLRELLQQMPAAIRAYESHIFVYTYTTEFNGLNRTGKIDEALALIPAILKGLKYFESRIHPSEALVFYFNFAIAFLFNGDFRNAYRWANTTLLTLPGNRTDLEFSARWILLFAAYQRNDPAFFLRLLKKQIPALRMVHIASDFTEIVSGFLEDLAKCSNRKISVALIRSFQKKASKIKWSGHARHVVEQLELNNWLESLVQKKSVAEVRRIK